MRREILFAVLSILITSAANAVTPSEDELEAVRHWVAAKFVGKVQSQADDAYLSVAFKSGRLLKNMATTKVYHKQIGALPLKIADKQYRRGLHCPSTGRVTVHLPGPGKTFSAVFGIDSNRAESFYSNAGQGRVIGTVEVRGEEIFRSQTMREGMAGVSVSAGLAGATEFTLVMRDAGGGIVERVDFNQADWADARVELENGQTLWLGDLPIAPLAAPLSTALPFSFSYGGRPSRDLLSQWSRSYSVQSVDEHRRHHTVRFVDPSHGLEVRCEGIEFVNFPVVEWKLVLENTGDQDTLIIEKLRPLDLRLERNNEGEFLLHHSNGSPHSLVRMSDSTDYAPQQMRLPPQAEKQLGAKLGLPASNDLPFFNLEANGQGVIVAIGWPGQWAASLKRDKDRGIRLIAGQEVTRFKLLPGEKVRSPLIAMLLWRGGDWLRAQNLWRRWMIAHNLPRTADGRLPPSQHAASSSAFYMESTLATEANQLMFIKRYREEGMEPDYWWIDAGWYEYEDYWLNVGTWRPNKKRFPNGLRPISDHLHKQDMKMILWFTPECVTRGSYIDRTHPEWLLKGGADWWMGHALIQGEFPAQVNDSGLTLLEDVAAFGIGNPDTTVTGKTQLADGRWHLITATRAINKLQQRSQLRLYVDGRLEASGTSSNVGPMNANDSWGVGRQYQTRGIVGEIDDVRIYDSAVTPVDVAALYRGTPPSKVPVARYTFDETLEDPIGQQHGKQIGAGQLKFVRGASGKAGDKSLRFNNDYGIKIPNQVPHDFTLSCWIRMDAPQLPPWGRGDFRLVHFGDPGALKGMTELVDRQLRQQGVDFYRHDGIPPLSYWRSNDALDRQGITEIKYVEGLLSFWDELRRRHPMLRIDICSGGGSRNELETLRRAVPLWRSDYAYEPTGMQTLTYGMALWIPYFGTGVNASDAYTFRSQMAPAISTSWDLRRRDIDYNFRRRMLSERKRIADHYYGDFYPLTPNRVAEDVWIAWQFHQSDAGEGIVQAFRRPHSPALSMQFRLRGLDLEARYEVNNLDGGDTMEFSGAVLMQDGLTITLPKPRSAALIEYKRR